MYRFAFALLLSLIAADARGEDWPMFGRDSTRNAVSPEKKPPLNWSLSEPSTNIKWIANFASPTFGTPVVSGDRIWVVTSTAAEGNKQRGSMLKCLRAKDGVVIYEKTVPAWGGKAAANSTQRELPNIDLSGVVASTPIIEGDLLWYTTNRFEIVCLDLERFHNGKGEPEELWKIDLEKDLKIDPHAQKYGLIMAPTLGPIVKGLLFSPTANGAFGGIQQFDGPAFVAVDKDSGKLSWSNASPGKRVLHTQAAGAVRIEVDGITQIVAPQGDGWLRAFEPRTGRLLWQFDVNRKDAVWDIVKGARNYCLAPPVFHDGRIYVTTGRELELQTGVGRVLCIDPNGRGDVSEEIVVTAKGTPAALDVDRRKGIAAGERVEKNPRSKLVWDFSGKDVNYNGTDFGRTVVSVAVDQDLVIAVDSSGFVYCLDAKSGKLHWSHELLEQPSPPLIVDGHVYIGTDVSNVHIFKLSADKSIALPDGEPVAKIDMQDEGTKSSIFGAPIYANGTLYITTTKQLVAIKGE